MANNYYTRSFIKPVIQSWLDSMECTKPATEHNRLDIVFNTGKRDENNNEIMRFGIIQFYDKSIHDLDRDIAYADLMELSIYEYATKSDDTRTISNIVAQEGLSPKFWLHFEMHDFEFVMGQLSDFFKCLYDVTGNRIAKNVEKVSKEIKNILICCTAGMTSGYFAGMMQQRVDEECPECGIHVNNCNVNLIGECIDDYDIVLIAPQIAYKEKELKDKYGEKIQCIDRVDFATFNFDSVLNKILKLNEK